MTGQPARFAARHAVILAHPGTSSFSALVADAYCEAVRAHRQEAIVRDLYQLGFDPLLKDEERPHDNVFVPSPDVAAELDILQGTDVFVLVYPIWFGMPPAIMKGYIERVLGAGVTAQQVQHRAGRSIMTGRRLVAITSSGTSRTWLDREGRLEALRTVTERYLSHAMALKSGESLHFGEVSDGLAQEFIDQNLRDVADRAASICKLLDEEREVSSHDR